MSSIKTLRVELINILFQIQLINKWLHIMAETNSTATSLEDRTEVTITFCSLVDTFSAGPRLWGESDQRHSGRGSPVAHKTDHRLPGASGVFHTGRSGGAEGSDLQPADGPEEPPAAAAVPGRAGELRQQTDQHQEEGQPGGQHPDGRPGETAEGARQLSQGDGQAQSSAGAQPGHHTWP